MNPPEEFSRHAADCKVMARFTRGRVIDITPAAARVLGFSGLAPVKLSLATPDG